MNALVIFGLLAILMLTGMPISNSLGLTPTSRVRDNDHFQTLFNATSKWQTVTIEFSSLRQAARRRPVPWSGDDLYMINFDMARAAGAFGWLELDNFRFVK